MAVDFPNLMTVDLLLALGLVSGCSEYKLGPGDLPATSSSSSTPKPDDPAAPDLLVDPSSIAVTGLCDEVSRRVNLTNAGTADLTISDITATDPSWTVSVPDLPLVLSPGATDMVSVTGTVGTSALIVTSNDPDEPTVTVDLSAEGDAPPTVQITGPADGTVLADGAATTLLATVDDDEDRARRLSLLWTSSQDGVLSTDPSATDGTVSVEWPAPTRSVADHTLTLQATDSCGQTASDTVDVCQQALVTHDEISLVEWHFEGETRWDEDNSWLELTTPDDYLVGSAFETSVTVDGSDVEISFMFYIGGGSGADGFSLTALDSDRYGGVFLGGEGCGIGFGGNMASCTPGPALPGWSLELDTYYNDETPGIDPTPDDHLAFYFDGNLASITAWAALPEMEDTGWHSMSIVVAAPTLTASIDGTTYIDETIDGLSPFNAWIGFTAGTGGLTNYHIIDSLEVTEYTCDR